MNRNLVLVCGRVCVAVALLAGLLTPRLEAVIFRVGSTGPCTHATLAGAVTAAAANGPGLDSIYLSSIATLTSELGINNQSLEIAGGFSDCGDNDAGTATTPVIAQVNNAIHVFGGTSVRTVNLRNLAVIRDNATPIARLLKIEGMAIVSLYNTLLSSGSEATGGNVWMSGGDTSLVVGEWLGAGSSIYNGEASDSGGGIYCENGGHVTIESGAVAGNHAVSTGGGIFASGCIVDVFDGQTLPPVCPATFAHGILCNSADSYGGGIGAGNASQVNLIGDADAPALLFENDANVGGGLVLIGAGTIGIAENVWFVGNTGISGGGGVATLSGASFASSSTAAGCRGGACSLFSGNSSDVLGGAIAADSGSSITVRQARLTDNSAAISGSVAYALGAGSSITFESCISRDNAGSANQAFFAAAGTSQIRVAFSTLDEDLGCCRGLFNTTDSATVRVYSSILLPVSEALGTGRVFLDAIGAGQTRFMDCILYQESTPSLPPPSDPASYELVVNVTNLFANWGARDLRLRAGSQAIDFCDTTFYPPTTTDIEGQTRPFDVPSITDTPYGVYDLGADEWFPIFLADHEEGNCSAWSSGTGGC